LGLGILDSSTRGLGNETMADIDEDFAGMSRKELCEYIEEKFKVEENHFWNLHSTQKIRFCCQIIRNNKLGK
jgi:hypothetical protein